MYPQVSAILVVQKQSLVLMPGGRGFSCALWMNNHFEVDEHPFATYFDVHQGYEVLTHSHLGRT